jgi:NADPH:quinone reductase-like Zn-dependent oxidoreductase
MSRLVLTAVGGNPGRIVALDNGPEPAVGADDVLVAMEAAPINPGDLAFQQGWFLVQPQPPQALGAEGVGHVLKVGSAVDPAMIGRRVLVLPTFRHGTWGHRTVVDARDVVPVPRDGDALQFAMLAVNPATAYALLHDYGDVRAGDWIGLTLANSALGRCVLALAGRSGVRTLAIVRREQAARQVRALGAARVLIAGVGLGDRIAEALGDVRLRLLLDGGAQGLGELARSIEDGGTVVTYAAVGGHPPVLPLADLFRGVSLHGFSIVRWMRNTPRQTRDRVYAELAGLVENGVLRSAVEATYPLEHYRVALAHAARSQRTGKILFTPGQGITPPCRPDPPWPRAAGYAR